MSTDRDLVKRVVRTVDHQTGGPQPNKCPVHQLLTVLASHVDEDAADAVWAAAEQAVADGRLRYDENEREFWPPK